LTRKLLIRLILPIQKEEECLSQSFKSSKKIENQFFGDAAATAPHTDNASVAPTLLAHKAVLFANLPYYWCENTHRFAPARANFVNRPHLLNEPQDEDKTNDEFY
jgi:hypothetical protein